MSRRRSNLSRNQMLTLIIAVVAIIATIIVAFISGHDWFQDSTPASTVTSSNSSNNITSLAMEQVPGIVVSYAGSENNMGGTATLRKLFRDSVHTYILSYELPTDKEGYAGFVFNFDHGENVSKYREIEFTIQFQAKDKMIDLYLKDIAAIKDSVRVTSTGIEPTEISIKLEEFAGVNLNALKEIIFDVNTTFESGFQEIIVGNVRLSP